MKKSPNTPQHQHLARRDFLKKAGLSAAGFTIVPAHFLSAKPELRASDGTILQKAQLPPSDMVSLACCGIGGRGAGVLNDFGKTGLANIVALCDVDMGGPRTLKSLEKYPEVPRFQDFRKMYDKMEGEFDAVYIATPDFSHFPITIQAMSMGKHVYVEEASDKNLPRGRVADEGCQKIRSGYPDG